MPATHDNYDNCSDYYDEDEDDQEKDSEQLI